MMDHGCAMRQHLLARATACKMQLCTASLATASLLANLLAPLVLRYMQVQLQSFALYPNIRSIRSKAKLCNRTDAKHYFALRTDFLASRFTFLPPKTEISEKQKSKTQKQKCKSTCTVGALARRFLFLCFFLFYRLLWFASLCPKGIKSTICTSKGMALQVQIFLQIYDLH